MEHKSLVKVAHLWLIRCVPSLLDSYDSAVWWANLKQSHFSPKISPLVSWWEPDQTGSFRHFMINWFNVKMWLKTHIYKSLFSTLGEKDQDFIYIYIWKLLLKSIYIYRLFAQVHIKMTIFNCKHLDIKEREVMGSHETGEWVNLGIICQISIHS